METGDCDGAVDAAITALKCSVSTSSGLYMIAHDSLLEDIKWRLKDRLARCKVGHYLDKMTDVVDHPEFAGSQQIADYLKRTNLDVIYLHLNIYWSINPPRSDFRFEFVIDLT